MNGTRSAGPPCRLCSDELLATFVDLGMSPPCESFLEEQELSRPETTYPLRVWVCSRCLLVQLPAHLPGVAIFSDYAYFSSYSDSWLRHARRFVGTASERLQLGPNSLLVEVASNDGYLLRHAVELGIPVVGIEPAANVARAAEAVGVRTVVRFLGRESGREIAAEYGPADLVVANNVLAHVPDLLDFVAGLRALVSEHGYVSIEVPHLLRLIQGRQFDTIYHEHYSYYSLLTASRALATGGLTVVSVEELPTHGGSLRIWAQPIETATLAGESVSKVLAEEAAAGLHDLRGHAGFSTSVLQVKRDLLDFLIQISRAGQSVAGYGAPGKGNTLLNHCGIRSDLLSFTVDRNVHKQGRFLPGTHIPVLAPEAIAQAKPDYILILPWNLRKEVAAQLSYVRQWGGRLVVPIPSLEVF